MECGAVAESGVAVDPAVVGMCGLQRPREPRWCTVDRALRAIRVRRAGLDADEARWLREAEALKIWHPLGMVSALDYLERVLGYGPRSARDRLRVARALGDLPELTAALARGELPFSAVRELTRVATPTTEASWVAAATGKNLRQIEELVADHHPGDRPDDPPDPAARTHVVRFELSAETFARLRQARTVLDDDHGMNLADDAFVATLCNAVLDGASQAEPTGRAKFQIAMTVCERCRQGRQEGAGVQIAVSAAAVDRAMCDAQHIGSIDGDEPGRAYQDIPPSVARLVWRRDGGRCRVPGCRSSRGLELHHLIHRADGGTHDASNIALVCSACHQAHHDGKLTISGTADRIAVCRPGAHVDALPAVTPVARPGAHVDAMKAVTQTARSGAHVDMSHAVTPAARPGAHVDATEAATPAARAGAHVDASPAVMRAPQPSAHVDAMKAVTAAARPSAHMDASPAVMPAARPGAHVDVSPAVMQAPQPGAHVDASPAVTPAARSGAHVDASPAVMPAASPGTHVGAASKLDGAIVRTQAKAALIGLGWKPAIAQAAVTAAVAAEGTEVALERLIFEALRRCPAPRA